MSSSKSQKRKNKKKYYNSSKKPRSTGLDSGMKGFLVTCNDERQCVREAYNLLNESADEMYGPEFENTADKLGETDIDIEEQLAKEVEAIKSKPQRRFQQISTKVKGTIFINTTVPDPVSLVNKIFETVMETKQRRTRFILKLKPVVVTCKAYETDIRKALDDALLQYSAQEKDKEFKYKVESKITHNDKLTSSHLIWYVRDSVNSVSLKWTASILEPDIVVSFYVLRNVCCLSILPKYEDYKKYNLSSIVTSTDNNQSNSVAKDGEMSSSEKKDESSEENLSKNNSDLKLENNSEKT